MTTLPWSYCWRSLTRRRTRTLLTAAGIGLPVGVAILLLALVDGLTSSIRATGHPLNVLVTSRGAETIEFSAVERGVAEQVAASAHVATAADRPLASPEALFSAPLEEPGAEGRQAVVRGVRPVALAVHDQVRLAEGRTPETAGEIMVGPLAATQLGLPPGRLAPGSRLRLLGEEWTIVGRFTAPGTAFESEVWMPLDAALLAGRRDELNAVVIRARDRAAAEELLFDLELRPDLRVTGRAETDYYAGHARAFEPIRQMVLAMSGMLLLGGVFIGANTVFAAMTGRVREIGVLRTLGYRRWQLGAGFLLESLLVALLGGVAGCGLATLLNGASFRMPMGAFRCEVDPPLLLVGIAAALVIGFLGAIIPVARALHRPTIDTLRHRA